MKKPGSSSLLFLAPLLVFAGSCEGAAELDGLDPGESRTVAERAASPLLGAPAQAAGGYPTRWIGNAMTAVSASALGTLPGSRVYAMVAAAMYDAVNGIDRAQRMGREHALVPPRGAPHAGLRAAAAVAAAHAVLLSQTPGQAAVLDAALSADLAELGGLTTPCVELGRDWGARVGQQVVALRAADGTESALNMPPSTLPGQHRRTFDARFSRMVPFAIADKTRYTAPPPPALTSELYTRSFIDAKANGTFDGNPLHDEIARFWGGDEAAAWLRAARAYAKQEKVEESVSATVRLYALVAMSVADSGVVSHTAKAQYYTWRVVPAIQEADVDGNPATIADPAWLPRNGTGNLGSPEYTSGASAFAGGGSAALERFFCRRDLGTCFETETSVYPRCFASPSDIAKETGRARVLQGVHFQHSSDAGIAQGRGVGAEIGSQRLRPLSRSGQPLPACPRY